MVSNDKNNIYTRTQKTPTLLQASLIICCLLYRVGCIVGVKRADVADSRNQRITENEFSLERTLPPDNHVNWAIFAVVAIYVN